MCGTSDADWSCPLRSKPSSPTTTTLPTHSTTPPIPNRKRGRTHSLEPLLSSERRWPSADNTTHKKTRTNHRFPTFAIGTLSPESAQIQASATPIEDETDNTLKGIPVDGDAALDGIFIDDAIIAVEEDKKEDEPKRRQNWPEKTPPKFP
ncbi:hypothetical protein BU23DRAFT_569747 [Bimuria novae-zelandiae CBS 107.79]|uniref:Uncharacterized protein n=1 Tax=Bimuria novae-zelandiae CBS 107.79 TaxID=1447943 RepID=A0A6A5V2V3_9PLEO|nr:hypothetical protein BU23DRAFT_569747 [Bimuria novae-zelandiae CBS 107.79]